MKRSQLLASQMKANSEAILAAFKPYLDENGEVKEALPDNVAAQVKTLQTEGDSLRGQYEGALGEEAISEKAVQTLKDLGKAQLPVPLPGKSLESEIAERGQKGASLESTKFEGMSHFDYKVDEKTHRLSQLSLTYEEGEAGIGDNLRKAIGSKDYQSAFRNYVRHGYNSLTGAEQKIIQEGVDSQGGFLVPDDVLNVIISKQPTPTRVAGRVTRVTTSRDSLNMPRVVYNTDDIYTTGIRVTKTGEKPASSTVHRATTPTFGSIKIPVHTYMLSLPITQDMIEDSAFPIVSWVAGKFSETVDLLKDNEVINGNGLGGPEGLLLGPGTTDQPATVVTGDANLLTPDGIIDLAYTLPEQYDENAWFLLNKTNAARAIAKMKDTTNRYLFGYGDQDTGFAGGRPKELVGYPYMYSAFMPDVAANAFPIIFGDFRGYFMVDRIGFSIQILRELYAETNQIVVLGRLRFGGQVVEPWRLKVQKVST